ncbi:MAG TPA: transketolase C-terminal domain-containing protein [Vicinamibacterales bacterium]|nr:transketolase C-terminal domain-containing protein [Vicinamibacterales bacterium]
MAEAGFVPSLIGTSGETLREAFGKALTAMAERYPALVVLDADVAGGTGTHHFRRAHPGRFVQFGIAEQNMIGAAAGMALAGCLPVATTFAVFALRTIEQVRQSIAYPRLNVKLAASHPGLDAGPDGASAQALEDIAAFRAIPGMTVVSPADPIEMARAVPAILDHRGPVYLRTGRSPARRVFDDDCVFELGRGRVLRDGSDVTIVACGVEVARALDAADLLARGGVSARVVNMSTIKPIDAALLAACARETGAFVTAEDHNIVGGLGGAVAEALAQSIPSPIEFVGVRDVFGESGEPEELAVKYGLTGPSIAEAAHRVLARKGNRQ